MRSRIGQSAPSSTASPPPPPPPPSEKTPGEPPLPPPPPLLLPLRWRLAVRRMYSHSGTLAAGSHVQSAGVGVTDKRGRLLQLANADDADGDVLTYAG
jgi:hypothetical protein